MGSGIHRIHWDRDTGRDVHGIDLGNIIQSLLSVFYEKWLYYTALFEFRLDSIVKFIVFKHLLYTNTKSDGIKIASKIL